MAKRGKLQIAARILPDGAPIALNGREAQTLDALVDAGVNGITSLETFRAGWAVRLAAYVGDLRKFGFHIETTREDHDGGNHARYRLISRVQIVARNDQPEIGRAA